MIAIDLTRFLVDTLMIACIYMMLSCSLNLEYGYAGIPNIGKVLFFAAGSFTVASLSIRVSARILGISYENYAMESRLLVSNINQMLGDRALLSIGLFALLCIAAILSSVAIAYLLSYPTIRLRGVYLGVTLLVTGEILRYIGRYNESFLGGTLGSPVIDVFRWIGGGKSREFAVLALYAIIAALIWSLTYRMMRSPYGRLLKSIREDEEVAESLGKDIDRARVNTLALGSMISGLAGALYAFYIGHIDSGDFTPDKTFIAFLIVIIGGRGNPYGPLAGALFYVMVERTIRQVKYSLKVPFDINYMALLIFGIVLLLLMLFRPSGLFAEKNDLDDMHRRLVKDVKRDSHYR